MKATLVALAITAGALAGAASAQDMTMEQGISMLATSADKALKEYGINNANVMDLTLTQLAGIKLITGSSDYSETEKKAAIMSVLGMPIPAQQ